jgi:hypothetical protein
MAQDEAMDVPSDDTTHVKSLKEIKKSRRTMMLSPAMGGDSSLVSLPLSPPLSERTSSVNDGEEMYSPEREERYESVDLSSEDGLEWDQSDQEQLSMVESEEVCPLPSADARMQLIFLHAWKRRIR